MKIIAETNRLVIREFLDLDAYEIFSLNSSSELMKLVNEKPYTELSEAENFITQVKQHYELNRFGLWSVYETRGGRFLGWCGLRQTKFGAVLNIRFKKKFWNKGYATEAIDAVIEYSDKNLTINKISAKANMNNPATLELLKKSKMQPEEDNKMLFRYYFNR